MVLITEYLQYSGRKSFLGSKTVDRVGDMYIELVNMMYSSLKRMLLAQLAKMFVNNSQKENVRKQ